EGTQSTEKPGGAHCGESRMMRFEWECQRATSGSTPDYDSIKLFVASLNCYENQMPHILVRNLGLCDDWTPIDEDESVQKLIKKYRVKVIDFPKLGYQERYKINQNRLKFDDAREYQGFGILGKQRVVNFLKAAYSAFDSTGMWLDNSSTA
ncbi:MAG: hypothetical protein SWZ49_25470, partial [Cyanobacteriota bacterium]|nr:hypothetical protein [Cyanobacteriota bacterium]